MRTLVILVTLVCCYFGAWEATKRWGEISEMKLGDDLIMMGYPGSGYRNPKRLGHSTQSLYVNVENVDKHFGRAKKAGATILEAPADTEYGHRRYGAEDPEGHRWYFAQEIHQAKSKRQTRVKKT